MEKKDVMEGNILIAEFMGLRIDSTPDKVDSWFVDFGNLDSIYHNKDAKEPKYHTSWDWLMPVVEKIQSIDISPPPNYRGYRIEIVVQGYVKIEGFPMPTITTNVSIEGSLMNAVYKAVIQFIQWYNTTL